MHITEDSTVKLRHITVHLIKYISFCIKHKFNPFKRSTCVRFIQYLKGVRSNFMVVIPDKPKPENLKFKVNMLLKDKNLNWDVIDDFNGKYLCNDICAIRKYSYTYIIKFNEDFMTYVHVHYKGLSKLNLPFKNKGNTHHLQSKFLYGRIDKLYNCKVKVN